MTDKEYQEMLQVYKKNEAASKKYRLDHQKFLDHRGITQEQFEYKLEKIINKGINNFIKNTKKYLESRGIST